tara:strand:- start:1 stop:189 length:189 start_codon:yes stop_codon:yes gene_type:complete
MNTFKVRNNNSKKLQKNTNNNNSNTKKNTTNLRISKLLIKRQGLKRELNILNAAIRVLKARK